MSTTKKKAPVRQTAKQKPIYTLTKEGMECTIYEEDTNFSVFKEENSRISRTFLPNKKSVDALVASLVKTGYTKS